MDAFGCRVIDVLEELGVILAFLWATRTMRHQRQDASKTGDLEDTSKTHDSGRHRWNLEESHSLEVICMHMH